MPHPQRPTQIKSLKRPPLILIHGFRGAPIGLQSLAQHLAAAGYDVHTPAIPPFGGATLNGPYDGEHYADFIANYIRSHNLERPILIGHSMGSIITAATAQFYPELLNRKLVLLSPIPVRTSKLITLISPLAAFAPSSWVDHITTRFLFASPNKKLYRTALEITHRCGENNHPSTKDFIAATNFSTHNSVSDFKFRQKVLIVAGAHDHIVNPRQTIALAKQLQAELHFIPNAGHLHNYEAPTETAQLILDFIQ